jgi:twinkle protein
LPHVLALLVELTLPERSIFPNELPQHLFFIGQQVSLLESQIDETVRLKGVPDFIHQIVGEAVLVHDKAALWVIQDTAQRPFCDGGEITVLFPCHKVQSKLQTRGEPHGHSFGFAATLGKLGGGGDKKQQWIDCEYDRLARFEEIYLCMDRDEEGAAATQELIMRLGAERCRIVELTQKDANECLQAGVTPEEIQLCLSKAAALDPEELQQVDNFRHKVLDLFHSEDGVVKESATLLPWAKLKEHLELRPGELTIWTGINGHGKSQMLSHAALHMILQGQKVCIASMEIKPERLLYKMTKQAAGVRHPSRELIHETFDWLGDDLWLFNVVGNAKTSRLLEVFRYARKRYGVNHFVVDSLLKCGLAEDDYNGQKLFVEQLCDFKNQYDCHVHLVVHPRKGNDEYAPVGKMDVKGSGAITDLADNIVSVWRNKKKEEMMAAGNEVRAEDFTKPDAFLTCDKQRNGEWEGRLALWFDRESGQFLNQQGDKPSSYSKSMKPF